MRRLHATLAGVLLAGTCIATAAAQTIEVWHHGGRGDGERETIEALIAQWNAANPDAQAELVLLPEGSYNEQVQAAALAGDLPDLLDFDGPNYANYVWSGYLQPIDALVDPALLANALPSIIAQGTYAPDGKLYSLGMFDSGLAVWGNRAYLEAAGVRIPDAVDNAWTMDEFEAALAALQALPEVEYALDLKLNYGQGEWYTYGFGPIVQSLGGDLIDRTAWRSGGVLDSSAAVEAMTHFKSWVDNGWVVPASVGDDAFYGTKTAALAFVGHWMWTPHRENLGDDLVLIPMPKFGAAHATGMGSWCWGITSDADPNTARLLEFLMTDEAILSVTTRNGAVPATKTAIEAAPEFAKGGPLSLFVAQLNAIAVPRPAHPAYPTITAAFAQAVADVIDGADPAEALTDAAARIDEDIDDNGGYPPFGG
ncbi:MAG: sugar ABC transporter substrate-binding protein [Alphaproteobacteria bacterium]